MPEEKCCAELTLLGIGQIEIRVIVQCGGSECLIPLFQYGE